MNRTQDRRQNSNIYPKNMNAILNSQQRFDNILITCDIKERNQLIRHHIWKFVIFCGLEMSCGDIDLGQECPGQ